MAKSHHRLSWPALHKALMASYHPKLSWPHITRSSHGLLLCTWAALMAVPFLPSHGPASLSQLGYRWQVLTGRILAPPGSQLVQIWLPWPSTVGAWLPWPCTLFLVDIPALSSRILRGSFGSDKQLKFYVNACITHTRGYKKGTSLQEVRREIATNDASGLPYVALT